jgi:hypothetical protein
MLHKRDVRLSRIPIVHRGEREYHAAWTTQRLRHFERMGGPPPNDAQPDGRTLHYWASNPPTWPFADLYGFADVFWDGGTRILADTYYRGDGRYAAGRALRRIQETRLLAQEYYMLAHRIDLAYLARRFDAAVAATAVNAALDQVEEHAQSLRGVALTEDVRRLLTAVDWPQVLIRPS